MNDAYRAHHSREHRSRAHRSREPRRPAPKSNNRRTPTKSASPAHNPIVNGLPGQIFAIVLGLWSLAINLHNVYSKFAPEATSRFIASGILNFTAGLPLIGFLSFCFRIGAFVLAYLLFQSMRKHKLWKNPVWLLIWITCLYSGVVGLGKVILTFPLLMAAFVVGFLQYLEIIFWNARKPGLHLWFLVVGAYSIEVWLQYELMPFHTDYDTFLGLVQAMFSLGDFNWQGFEPIQLLFAAIGIFGIELSERIAGIVEKYG